MLDLDISLRPPSRKFPYDDHHHHQLIDQQGHHNPLQQHKQHHHRNRLHFHPCPASDHIGRLQLNHGLQQHIPRSAHYPDQCNVASSPEQLAVVPPDADYASSQSLSPHSDWKLSCSELNMLQKEVSTRPYIQSMDRNIGCNARTMESPNATGLSNNQINVEIEEADQICSSISTTKPYLSLGLIAATPCKTSFPASSSPSHGSCFHGLINKSTEENRSISKLSDEQVISRKNSYANKLQELETPMDIQEYSVPHQHSCTEVMLRYTRSELHIAEELGEAEAHAEEEKEASLKHLKKLKSDDHNGHLYKLYRDNKEEEEEEEDERNKMELLQDGDEEIVVVEEENNSGEDKDSWKHQGLYMIRELFPLKPDTVRWAEAKIHVAIDDEEEETRCIIDMFHKDEEEAEEGEAEESDQSAATVAEEEEESGAMTTERIKLGRQNYNNYGVNTPKIKMSFILPTLGTKPAQLAGAGVLSSINRNNEYDSIMSTKNADTDNNTLSNSNSNSNSNTNTNTNTDTNTDTNTNTNTDTNANANSNTKASMVMSTVSAASNKPSLSLMPWFNSAHLRTRFTDNHNNYVNYDNSNVSCPFGVQIHQLQNINTTKNTNVATITSCSSSSSSSSSSSPLLNSDVIISKAANANHHILNRDMSMAASSAAELATAIAMTNANNICGSNSISCTNNNVLVQRSKKSRRGPRSRSSQYRGVTFYRRTGRWESHIWDTGKQVYLGGFDTSHAAARAYDRAAIKFRGLDADINFQLADYEDEIKHMGNLSKEEFVRLLRRRSIGFPRGSKRLRGNMTLHKYGRWDAASASTGHFCTGIRMISENTFPEKDNASPNYTSIAPISQTLYTGREPLRDAEKHSLDLSLRMEPLIWCQQSQTEAASNSFRMPNKTLRTSPDDSIQMKDQIPWSLLKNNHSVVKCTPFMKRLNNVEPIISSPLQEGSMSTSARPASGSFQWQGHQNIIQSNTPAAILLPSNKLMSSYTSPSRPSSPLNLLTSSSSSQQPSHVMQYKNGPYIAASSGFSQGKTNHIKNDQLKMQQQWPTQHYSNMTNKTGLPRSSSCISSITTSSEQTNSTNVNMLTHSRKGFPTSWTVNDMDRNPL